MNVFLGALQIVLALHTAVGAIWKTSESERTVPSLGAIPHGVWTSLAGLEVLCAIALIVPLFEKRAGILAPIAAALVVAEMLYFSGVDLTSGSPNIGEVIYWLVVAAVSAFVVYGRLVLKPIRQSEFA
jgi:xanthine/uracil/vitamin C permease (AzgA family)